MLKLLESDFRCSHPRLVQILPGRELEAVAYATRLQNIGMCDGIYVQGKEVTQWGFLDKASGFNNYIFSDVSDTFKGVDFGFMREARLISIMGVVCDMDFSIFPNLRWLEYQWAKKAVGFDQLDALTDAYLWGVGRSKNASSIHLSGSVQNIGFVRYGHDVIDLGSRVKSLRRLLISRARALVSIPELSSLKSLDIAYVGSNNFDYASIPSDIEFLSIFSCAPIRSWDFILRLDKLKSLVINKTSCPIPDGRELDAMSSIPAIDVPHVRKREVDLGAEWRSIVNEKFT